MTDKFIMEYDTRFKRDFKKYLDNYICPCCNYPTLNGRMGYEICGLCDWEDDGQDDVNADEVVGGPNQDYSLTEARNNFKEYNTMYRPSDTDQFERFDKNKLIELKNLYDLSLKTGDEIEVKNILRKANRLADSLRK